MNEIMENKTATQDNLNAIAQKVKFCIDCLEDKERLYNRKMDDDFLYGFRYYTVHLCDVQMRITYMRRLQKVVEKGSLVSVLSFLNASIELFTSDIQNSQVANKTADSNMTHFYLLEIELKTYLLEICKSLRACFESELR